MLSTLRTVYIRNDIFFFPAAGNSEDSDYTSDFNYPICQQEANSSASQFRNLAGQLEMSPSSSPEHPNTSINNIYLFILDRGMKMIEFRFLVSVIFRLVIFFDFFFFLFQPE